MTQVSMSLQVGDESITVVGMDRERALTIAHMLLDTALPDVEAKMAEAYTEAFSRKLPVLGQESRSTFPTGGPAKPTLPNGVRQVDGKLVYRTKYSCTNADCKHVGNRYIWADSRYTKCHLCAEKLDVVQAVDETDWPDGVPVLDPNGYYFYADAAFVERAHELAE